MSFWGGEFVKDNLGVNFVGNGSVLPLEALVSLAVRKNPKRAHLLVSKVLGKHIPVDPRIIVASTEILAVMVDDVLNGHKVALASNYLGLLGDVLLGFKDVTDLQTIVGLAVTHSKPVVIGYAETATALGAILANKLDTYYIHSTRYPDADAKHYGTFEESHSHATSHNITPLDDSSLNGGSAVVLVDDELSTGNTVINTIRVLHAKATHEQYVIASLVDLRSAADKKRLDDFAIEIGVPISVVALSSGVVDLPVTILDDAQTLIKNALTDEVKVFTRQASVTRLNSSAAGLIHPKNGVNSFQGYDEAAQKISVLPFNVWNQKTLVLGLEEDMYLPIVVAQKLAETMNVSFSSTTRSPVLHKNIDTYAIKDKIEFTVNAVDGDTPNRFAYNIGDDFDNIIIFVESETHYNELNKHDGLIEKLTSRTGNIILVNLNNLPEPLTGPAFGSYSADDVQWLLKDLSDVELEMVTEEREEAIQLGGAHYAESLPIEYQPTKEYQELFQESLVKSGRSVAEAVGVVTELILKARNNEPVLVSLARAGTPVGVLIKRYAQEVHGLNLPHYAVSIVRGKGIDYNALKFLAQNYDPKRIIFIDGWTGKGAIVKELTVAIKKYGEETGVWFSDECAVLADPASAVHIFGTREDYLIPSACLNSTVSGLVSRTVLNDELIGENDFHGAKFYKEFQDNDLSNVFIDTVQSWFKDVESEVGEQVRIFEETGSNAPTWAGWDAIERIRKEYGINDINLVKPGVGETTRVLLRRVPWKIVIRKDQVENLKHIILLAEDRGTQIELVDELPYSCVGIIKPQLAKN